MQKTISMWVGMLHTNTYITFDDRQDRCVVIDPGAMGEELLQLIKKHGKTVEAILLTHCHFDHVGAVSALVQAYDCPVYMCPEDRVLPERITKKDIRQRTTCSYGEADVLSLAGLEIRVLHTPGHSPGSVCLLVGDKLFTGDTLFAGTCGRTDLPCGDPEQMRASLARLAALEGDYCVMPGHGPETTLAREKAENPYLKGLL